MEELRLVTADGRRVPLPRWTITLGRGADNDVVLQSTPLSRRHAEIRFDGQGWLLVDMGSTNGTTVDGRPLAPYQPYRLRSGSVVHMGDQWAFRVETAHVTANPFFDDEEERATGSGGGGVSRWILALAVVAAVLLVGLGVLLVLALGGSGEEPVPSALPTAIAPVPTATSAPAVTEAPAPPAPAETDGATLPMPTVTLATPELPAGGAAGPGGSGQGSQAGQGGAAGTPLSLGPVLMGGLQILLSWEAVGTLGQDEYYSVSVRFGEQGQVSYAGDWLQATEWRLPTWVFGRADQGRFEWDVTVRQATTVRADGSKDGPVLSPKSETWTSTWTEGGGEPPATEPSPPPPTATSSPRGPLQQGHGEGQEREPGQAQVGRWRVERVVLVDGLWYNSCCGLICGRAGRAVHPAYRFQSP